MGALTVVDLDAGGDLAAADRATGLRVGITRRSDPLPIDVTAPLTMTLAPLGGDTSDAVVAVERPEEELARLEAAIDRVPHAAAVFDGLLRATVPDVATGLLMESLAFSMLLAGPEFADWIARRTARPVPAPERPVELARTAGRLTITLNHPERRNAYSAAMRDALVEALELAQADRTIEEVVLRGNGPSFCSGGDLAEFGTAPDVVTAHLIRTSQSAGAMIARLGAEVTAMLHGHCVGAGIELTAFASRVVADPDVRLRLPEVGMGLIPGAGGTVSIRRRIGRWRLAYLGLSGAEIDARTALSWGLVDVIRSDDGSTDGLSPA